MAQEGVQGLQELLVESTIPQSSAEDRLDGPEGSVDHVLGDHIVFELSLDAAAGCLLLSDLEGTGTDRKMSNSSEKALMKTTGSVSATRLRLISASGLLPK